MNHNPPKISIVMPSLNQSAFLETAIDSVIGQDYPWIELVVIDGGSTDGSVEILERKADSIAYWSSAPDNGQSDALNKGFELLTGDIVGWLNSDDSYQPGTFREVAETFADANVGIAMCRTFGMMDADGKVFAYKDNAFTDHRTLVRYWTTDGMTINQPCVFLRRDLLRRFSPALDTRLHYAMDYDLWLRIATEQPITLVDGYWANYRFHERSKSGKSFDDFFPEWRMVSRRHWGRPCSWDWWANWFSYCYYHYFVRILRGVIRRVRRAPVDG